MRSSFLSATLPLLLLATSSARAQTADTKLTTAGLADFLKGLGYEPTKVGDTTQRIVIERDKFTFRINVSISGNEKKVWMSSYLVEIPDLSKVPPKALSDVLLSNGDVGPAHFYLVKVEDKHWLKVGFALDNRNLTPAYFRSELDWFMERMSDTAAVWDKAKWTPTP